MSTTREQSEFRPVKSTARTLEVLEELAAAPAALTLGEIARALSIPKSSLHGILRTMEHYGWVESDGTAHRFRIGLRALQAGAAYADTDDVVALTADTLDWLVDVLDETVHLGRLDGTDIIYIAKRETRQPLRMYSSVGRRLPAYGTALGKSLLAWQPEERLGDHVPPVLEPLTENTITSHERLRKELERTRERGYAIDDQESNEGVCCAGVALPTGNPPQDAISCSVPAMRFGGPRTEEIVERLLEAVERVSAALRVHGHRTAVSHRETPG